MKSFPFNNGLVRVMIIGDLGQSQMSIWFHFSVCPHFVLRVEQKPAVQRTYIPERDIISNILFERHKSSHALRLRRILAEWKSRSACRLSSLSKT